MGRYSLDNSSAWETAGRDTPDAFNPQDRDIRGRALADCRANGMRWYPQVTGWYECENYAKRTYDAAMRVLAERQVDAAQKLIAADPTLSSPRGQHTPSLGAGRKSADFFGGAIRTGGAMGSGTDSQGGDGLGTGSGGASVVVSLPPGASTPGASTPATPLEALPWHQRRVYALPGSPTYGVLAGIAAALAVGGYVWHKRARR